MVSRAISFKWRSVSGLILGLFSVIIAQSQLQADEKAEASPQLSFDRVFKSGEFSGKSYGSVRWREGHSDYLKWEDSEQTSGGKDLVAVDPESGEAEIIVPAAFLVPAGGSSPLGVSAYAFSDDRSKLLIFTNTKRVWRQNSRGDYWVLDISSRELKQLGGDAKPSTLMFAEFSPDGTRVCYVREKNLYVEEVRSGQITALTQNGGERFINGTFDWVYEEELSLRKGFKWSPDGTLIAFWQLDTEGVRVVHMINNTEGLYPRLIPIKYPKVGEQNSSGRIGVVSAAGGKTTWMNIPGDPRNHYIARMGWAENSEQLLIQQLNRLQNTNRVMFVDVDLGEAETLMIERDDAWVDVHDELIWFDDGKRFTWISERSGWRQAYVVNREGGKLTQITRGEFDVWQIVSVDENQGLLYYIASPDNPAQRFLYKVSLKGGKGERVTPDDQIGSHSYRISHDGKWAVHSWSSMSVPSKTDLVRLPSHERVRMLEDNEKLVEKLATIDLGGHEFFQVEVNGDALDGWCIRPPEFDENKQYPLLFYVYGEPAGQTATDRWGGRSYMWYQLLAQKGYFIMTIDNRGTRAPKGREWRKSIYRQVGIKAPADQAAATREVLKARPYIDPKRIAIWGWSGGGSMTLNAMFRYPELYHTGMAVAPVPNQRGYDTIYQERYMGLPKDNVDGFKNGSPINYAHQLEGNLLLIHGTGDDNCHYQGMEALIDELILHDKDFSMMSYPNRTHSISEGKNTRAHLYRLMTRFLTERMPAGAVERPDGGGEGK